MGDLVYRPVIVIAKSVFTSLGLKFDVVGQENIPRTGGAVLAINHTSYLDFAFAGVPADRVGKRLVRFMAKDGIFEHGIAGPLMRGMRHIPVDRDAGTASFRAAVDSLKSGELVGVFPEATMSRSFDIKAIKSGAVRMARTAKVPLIPMIVFGGHRIIGYGHRDLTRGRTICITVGQPIDLESGKSPDDMTDELRRQLISLLDQSVERYPDRPENAWWIPRRLGGSAPALQE